MPLNTPHLNEKSRPQKAVRNELLNDTTEVVRGY